MRTIYFSKQTDADLDVVLFSFLFLYAHFSYLFLVEGPRNEIKLNKNEPIKAIQFTSLHFTFVVNIEEEISFKSQSVPLSSNVAYTGRTVQTTTLGGELNQIKNEKKKQNEKQKHKISKQL